MSKVFWGSLISGAGLSIGGFAMLASSGFDVMNRQVWSIAFEIVRSDPVALIQAASGGTDAELFRGISFVFSGVGVMTLTLGSTSVFALLSALSRSAKGRRAQRMDPRRNSAARKPSAIAGITKKTLGGIKDRMAGDRVVELEDESSGGRFPSIAVSGLTQRMKVKRPLGDELKEALESLRSRLGFAVGDTPAEEKVVLQPHEAMKDKINLGVLTRWYEDAQSGTVETHELVSRAQAICELWKDGDFTRFTSEDPIDGAFIVRLVRSWAEREDVGGHGDEGGEAADATLADRERDREAMRRAMRATRNGELITDESEREIDLESEGLDDLEVVADPGQQEEAEDEFDAVMMEATDAPQDGGEGEDEEDEFDAVMMTAGQQEEPGSKSEADVQGVEEPTEGVAEEGGSGGEDMGLIDELVAVLSDMRAHLSLVQRVRDGEDEWPENLFDEDERSAHATTLSSQLATVEDFFDEDLLSVADRHEEQHEEFAWLKENSEILEKGFLAYVDALMNPVWGDDEDDDVDGEIEAEDETADDPEEVDTDVQPIVVQEPDVEEDEPGDEGGEAEQDQAEEDELHEPTDVSIAPLDELERAGSIPFNWGKNCKDAGATGGTIAKLIFDRNGNEFKPLGVAHIHMKWEGASGDKRFNVILKHVPQGTWSIRIGEDLRLEDENGDYVLVSEDLLKSEDLENAKTVIHFYGDEFEGIEDMKVKDSLFVTSRVFDAQEIRDFLNS